MRIGGNTNLKWLLGDHPSPFLRTSLGSTSVTADYAGTLISRTLYKPWGEVRYQSGTIPTNYILPYTQDRLYTGQYAESYINLRFYGSRRYDPYQSLHKDEAGKMMIVKPETGEMDPETA